MPEWEIIEWNEKNLDLDEIPYCRQAYDCKKYAFVSDYFRFRILAKYGGLYLDTDVELLRSIEGILSQHKVILGFENKQFVNPGLICYANGPGLPIFKEITESYCTEEFLKPDGTPNLFTVCERVTPLLEKKGFRMDDTYQVIDGIALYPHEYFCPTDHVWSRQDFTENTCSIHHYDASWGTFRFRTEKNIKKTIYKVFKPRFVKTVLYTVRKFKGVASWKNS